VLTACWVSAHIERCGAGWRIRGKSVAAEILGVKPTTIET